MEHIINLNVRFPDGQTLFNHVAGDVMAPRYHDGDLLEVQTMPLADLRPGQDVVVWKLGGKACFRRVAEVGDGELGEVVLQALNPKRPDTIRIFLFEVVGLARVVLSGRKPSGHVMSIGSAPQAAS